MSAPHSPGGVTSVNASRSAAATTCAPTACAASATAASSAVGCRRPSVVGVCTTTQKARARSGAWAKGPSATTTAIPNARIRVCSTASDCGSKSAETRTTSPLLVIRRAIAAASATAVASSSRLAPAIGSPVRSATTVWKLNSISSRPWLISGWYGV